MPRVPREVAMRELEDMRSELSDEEICEALLKEADEAAAKNLWTRLRHAPAMLRQC